MLTLKALFLVGLVDLAAEVSVFRKTLSLQEGALWRGAHPF